MRRKLAVLLTLALVLTIFSGTLALAEIDERGVTTVGMFAGSRDVVITYQPGVLPPDVAHSVILYAHPTSTDTSVRLGTQGHRTSSDATKGGTITLRLNRELVEGEVVRLTIGNPNSFAPFFYTIPPVPPVSKIGSDTTITITAPLPIQPFLIDSESDDAAAIFSVNVMQDNNLRFGKHAYTTEKTSIDSQNVLSIIYGYQETYEQNMKPFELTCEVSDYLMEDDTPIFNEFSLFMKRFRTPTVYRQVYTSYVNNAGIYEGKEEFTLRVGEPVVAVKTDGIGTVLNDYVGTLLLEANAMTGIGDANATILWDVAFAVEP